MHNKIVATDYIFNTLRFQLLGKHDFDEYLMVSKGLSLNSLFENKGLDPNKNYGQVNVRTNDID